VTRLVALAATKLEIFIFTGMLTGRAYGSGLSPSLFM